MKGFWYSLIVVINFIRLVLKKVIKLAKGSLSNIFEYSFIKFYLNSNLVTDAV